MYIANNILEYDKIVSNISPKNIGFVPTMGSLHEGHLSLIKKSIEQNEITVCSIFINEIQFNNKNDYINYPRTEKQDIEMLENSKCDILFYPKKEKIYTEDFHNKNIDMKILDGLGSQMEGKYRKGHFDGVIKIVDYFFEILKPNNAYFGEKDFQQYLIIDKYVRKTKKNINIIPCPIFREENGLAMSSRNVRLSKDYRQKASIIYKTLKEIRHNYNDLNIEELKNIALKNISNEKNFELEYVEIASEKTLEPLIKKSDEKCRVFISVFVEGVRLIDNIILN